MKGPGMRAIKTAISVLICIFLYLVLRVINVDFANTWYNPFFAGIAAAYSLYPDKLNSFKQAKNRIVASIIGGVIGMVLIIFYTEILNLTWPNFTMTNTTDFIIPYILVALCVIAVIMTGVLVKQRGAIFVSILTFLSVTVNPSPMVINLASEWIFGVNRILSTVIGVLISLSVNLFSLPKFNKNKKYLFCLGIEEILKHDVDKVDGFIKYKLNALTFDGINFTLCTTRTPTKFMYLLEDIEINHPVVCMCGAALYDTKKLSYIGIEPIEKEVSQELDKILDSYGVSPFKNYIIDDVLNIYNKKIDNKGEALYMNSVKNAPYCSFTLGECQSDDSVLFYLLAEPKDEVDKIIKAINDNPIYDKLLIQVSDYFDNQNLVPDLKYIKIYNKDVLKLRLLHEYCNNNFECVGLAVSNNLTHLLDNSVIAVTNNNDLDIKSQRIIYTKSYEQMIKKISKIYYSKKFK